MDLVSAALLVVFLGLVFDYTNGFHDAANVVSTVIATKVLKPLTAIILAGVLNTIGATQISGVAKTIAEGIVKPLFTTEFMIISALIGAIGWNIITWYFGMPSSSSYALIGGLLGPALFEGGGNVVLWNGLFYKVIIPMFLSPLAGFFLGWLLMKLIGILLQRKWMHRHPKLFNHLQVVSASLVALAHGLNDAQKSMGIIALGLFSAGYLVTPDIPIWVIGACAITIGLGTASGGFRIIQTVGYQITKLEPVQGFAAETGASIVILLASAFGMPISSTHMIVGSVAGVGAAKSNKKVRWEITHKLLMTWCLTIPGSAVLAILFYYTINFFN